MLVRLALLFAIAVPPLFTGLGAGDSDFHMEVRALQSAQETWFRQQHDPQAWLVPTWNGAPRLNKPPLAVWVDLLAWSGLQPEAARIDTLVWRARAAAAGLALLMLLALIGAEYRLRDAHLGGLAAASTAGMLLFLRQARLASYDTCFMAFAGIALCAGLCAAAPLHAGARRWPYWLLFGIALGLAVLAKGPLAFVLIAVPVCILAAFGQERRKLVPGAIAALLLSIALAAPWYVHLLRHVPGAAQALWTEYEAGRSEAQPFWYYLGIVGLVAPWCLWLPAGLWRLSRRGETPKPWADRAWLFVFAWIFLVLSVPEAKQQRYIAVILPAAGWIAAAGWIGARSRLLAHTHGALLSTASLFIASIGVLQPWALAHGHLARSELVGPGGCAWAMAGAGLAAIALASWKLLLVDRREAAGWLTALWMAGAATLLLPAYERSHHGRYAHRADAERVAAMTAGRPFHHLADRDTPSHLHRPPPGFLLYLRRAVPALAPHEARAPDPHGWLMAPRAERVDAMLRKAGWAPVLDFDDGSLPRTLYAR